MGETQDTNGEILRHLRFNPALECLSKIAYITESKPFRLGLVVDSRPHKTKTWRGAVIVTLAHLFTFTLARATSISSNLLHLVFRQIIKKKIAFSFLVIINEKVIGTEHATRTSLLSKPRSFL